MREFIDGCLPSLFLMATIVVLILKLEVQKTSLNPCWFLLREQGNCILDLDLVFLSFYAIWYDNCLKFGCTLLY